MVNDYFTDFISNHPKSEMLLIQDVKYINVPTDVYEIEDLVQKQLLKNANPFSIEVQKIKAQSTKVQREIVRGIRYKNYKGREICIGIPQEIQAILGLPFSDFYKLRMEITNLKQENMKIKSKLKKSDTECNHVRLELKKIKKFSFLKRLKFLFTKSIK